MSMLAHCTRINPYLTTGDFLQQEGDVLARKNGELEATARKLRGQLKDAVSDQERLNKRLAQQDELMAAEKNRLEKKFAEASKQVALLLQRETCSRPCLMLKETGLAVLTQLYATAILALQP